MAKVAYYPGCALEGSGGPYDRSTRALVDKLGLQMQDLVTMRSPRLRFSTIWRCSLLRFCCGRISRK